MPRPMQLTPLFGIGFVAAIFLLFIHSKIVRMCFPDGWWHHDRFQKQEQIQERKVSSSSRFENFPENDENFGILTKTQIDEHILLNSFNLTVLNPDADLIVRSVIKSYFHPPPTASRVPGCKGDRLKYEVEDILCIPRPKYLPRVKNPCWWDPPGQTEVMRCLPYFHILGLGKSGSTDLWDRITRHPHVYSNHGLLGKEANWWAWRRYGYRNYNHKKILNFTQYTNTFQELAHEVRLSLLKGDDRHMKIITGDASPSDLADFRGWPRIPQNRQREMPQVLTPHLMKHFYSNPKFIVIFRNPVERIYSEYRFINGSVPKTAKDFHSRLLKSIEILAKCVRQSGVQACFFDHHVYSALPLRLHFFFYSLYVQHWLKMFPRDTFLFIKTEDYGNNIKETIRSCLKFLALEPLEETQMEEIGRARRQHVTAQNKPMWPATRWLLQQMAKPSMLLLAHLLDDERFLMD